MKYQVWLTVTALCALSTFAIGSAPKPTPVWYENGCCRSWPAPCDDNGADDDDHKHHRGHRHHRGKRFCQPVCNEAPAVVRCGVSGQLLDYTANHGADRRIYSRALNEKRDLYVYLPPGYDCNKYYPFMMFLHGVTGDEKVFVEMALKPLDRAIREGKLPPMIVAAPDGSLCVEGGHFSPGSFFINSQAGDFQDFIVEDIWGFMMTHFPIRPEPEAHVICGASMGGFGAYNIGIKNPDKFKIIVGVLPVLNLRWMDCCGNYDSNFDPYNWGWRNQFHQDEIIGRFVHGLVKIRVRDLLTPVFGEGCAGMLLASWENPIELIDRYKVKCGDLDMFCGYACLDEFNLDAQSESFIYYVKSRQIPIAVQCVKHGKHDEHSATSLIPHVIKFINDRMTCYGTNEPLCVGENLQ